MKTAGKLYPTCSCYKLSRELSSALQAETTFTVNSKHPAPEAGQQTNSVPFPLIVLHTLTQTLLRPWSVHTPLPLHYIKLINALAAINNSGSPTIHHQPRCCCSCRSVLVGALWRTGAGPARAAAAQSSPPVSSFAASAELWR